MIIKYNLNNVDSSLVNKFTVKNKNYDRLVKMKWFEMPYLRNIKLFYKTSTEIYFPIWQFNSILKPTKLLTDKLVYNSSSPIKQGMEDMIAEQESILTRIEFEGLRTGLINMKTARWKWNTLIKLISMYQEKTLILVHNIKTLNELKKKFEDFSNIVPWVYYSKKKDIKDITITTHKSFSLSPEIFAGKFGILIMDEADTNLSAPMMKAIMISDVDWLFWFTGTPYRQELDTDDMTLIFWPLLKVEWQANNWYNMLPKIIRYEAASDICSYEHFHELYEQLMWDTKRTSTQVDLIEHSMKSRKLWLVLVERKVECEKYHWLLKAKWINSCIVNWDTKELEDEENINNIIKSWGVIVATSDKMSRWVDIPAIDTIFIFYPNKFQGNIVQAVWRWLRVYEWKEDVVVYDWVDCPILKHQWRERLRSYRKEYGEIEIKSFTI